jgi:7-cyano-7-deazaguanine synthase
LVLLSGGLDSTTLLASVVADSPFPQALYVDYGQPAANKELTAARAVSARYSVNLVELSLSGLRIGTSGEIPGRNALLAVAGLMYVMPDSAAVMMAIHSGTGYPDCSPAFVEAQQRIFDLYARGSVILSAPFIKWTKSDIWAVGKTLNIPVHLTYSCERGLTQPCGGCRSCGDLQALLEAS